MHANTQAATLLFVCTGNICRSPTAEAIARQRIAERGLAARFQAASAGTHGYHIGEPPDARACRAARARGYRLDGLTASQCSVDDIARAQLVLALDSGHLQHLRRLAPPELHPKIRLLMSYIRPQPAQQDIPDPYYADAAAFARVIDLCETAIDALLDELAAEPV